MIRFTPTLSAFALVLAGPVRVRSGAPTTQSGTQSAQAAVPSRSQLAREIALLRLNGEIPPLPAADSFSVGPMSIALGVVRHGSAAVSNGNLDVTGRLEGDAIALRGDVVIHRGGEVTGDAISVGGRVVLDGGRVDGEMRSFSGIPSSTPVAAPQPRGTWQSVKLVVGWFAILFVIGLGVLIFAESNLDGVVMALERNVTRAFLYGLLGELALLPALLLLIVGLAITLLGILLIPFAIVAYVIAVAGVVTLGFLAVARLTGRSIAADRAESARGVNLRALFVGLSVYMGLWLVAAFFAWSPVTTSVLRAVALAATWVPVTAGFGAALLSRAGTQRPGAALAPRRPVPDDLAWQTPTPVTGVAAARRPRPVPAKEIP